MGDILGPNYSRKNKKKGGFGEIEGFENELLIEKVAVISEREKGRIHLRKGNIRVPLERSELRLVQHTV